jgi:hypothetical protein
MLERPSDDSVEMASVFVKEFGAHLHDVAPQGLHRREGSGGGRGVGGRSGREGGREGPGCAQPRPPQLAPFHFRPHMLRRIPARTR